jgi:spore germination protein (amino acid permease)
MDKFNTKHLFFIISGTAIITLKTYPVVFTRNGNRDSWIAVLISSVFIFFYFAYILKVSKKLKNYNIYDIYCKALGNTLGNFFIFIFVLTLFFTLVESSSIEANAMHTNMLVETPTWFFLFFFVVPGIYTVSRNKVAILSITIVGIILISIAGTNLAVLTAKYKDYTLLFPIFEDGITTGFILSILESLGMYASLGIMLPYLMEVEESKNLVKHGLLSLVFVIQMEIVACIGAMASFDIKYMNTMAYPKLLQTQLVQHFRFLESGELFVMLQMLGGWYIKYILTFYALLKLLYLLKMESKLNIYIITVLVYAIAYFISSNLFVLYSYLNVYTYIALVNFFIIPLMVYTIYYFKYRKRKSQAASAS